MATWLKVPSGARLTDVRVSSEKRNERFSSARGQSTNQPSPSPSGALRKMIRQNVHAPSYAGFLPTRGPKPKRPPPRRWNCALAADAMTSAAVSAAAICIRVTAPEPVERTHQCEAPRIRIPELVLPLVVRRFFAAEKVGASKEKQPIAPSGV